MECLYCGYDFENDDKCPACQTDLKLMSKIYYISALLYNRGLKQAQNNDFYNAKISLRKSIKYNKRNVEARNLLGLIDYHTGKLADGVKQWIISTNFQDEDNIAFSYIDNFQKNIREFEKLNDAVKMYNHAIKYLKKKNDDVAIIRLKKAIDINPNFVDARNLLTLCYIKQDNMSKAYDIVEETLKIDIANPVALKLLTEINFSNGIKIKKPKPEETIPTLESLSHNKGTKKVSFAEKLAFMVVGAVCAVAVMGVLIIPSQVNSKNEKFEKINQQYEQLQKSYSDYQNEAQEKIAELENDNQQMKKTVEEYTATVQKSKNADNIKKAQKLFDEGKSVEAAKLIAAIDSSNLSDEVVSQYNQLKASAYATASNVLYKEGKNYLDNQDLENSKNSFNLCITFSENSLENKYNSYYQLGKIALSQNDNENAKKYFTEVKNNHPNSSIKGYAINYLSTLS